MNHSGMQRVKICHVLVLGELHGSQRSTLAICERLDPRRYDCHVICQGEGPLTEALRKRGIAYHLVPTLQRPIHPVRDWLAYRHIRQICSDHRFDIVHTHTSKGGMLGRLAARRAGVPHIVHHVRGFAFNEFTPPLKNAVYRRLEQFAGRFCDRIIFVNNEERQMCVDQGWFPQEACRTIYNGADLRLFKPDRHGERRRGFRRQFGVSENEVAILVCGRLDQQKQPLILPEIARKLERLVPNRPWRIHALGSGVLEAPLADAIRRSATGTRIALHGWQSHPELAMIGCDVFLLPSLWEGLPRVLIEAQAAGKPIVASDIVGNREVVTEMTGFLCEPRDPHGYATALAELVKSPGLRTRMGQAARERAESLFDVDVTSERVEQVYEEFVGTTRVDEIRRAAA